MNINPAELPSAEPIFIESDGPPKPPVKPTWGDVQGHLNAAQDSLRHAKRRAVDRYNLAVVTGSTDYWPEFLEEDVDAIISGITELIEQWATYDVEEAT